MALITMRQAITDALREEMHRDERVFIMGQEVGVWGGTYAVTRGFYDEFGEKRVVDTPITEYGFAGLGVGAAMGPTVAGGLMDVMGPGSLLLYFTGVLLLLALGTWRFIRFKPLNRGEPGQKADYVVMGTGSQAVLALDPRSPDPEAPPAPAGQNKGT